MELLYKTQESLSCWCNYAKSGSMVFCPKSGPQSGFSSLPDFLQPIVGSFTVGGVECLLIWSMCVAWRVFVNDTKEETWEGLRIFIKVLLYKVQKFCGTKSRLAMFRPQPLDCKGSPRDQTNRLDDPPSLGTSSVQHCPTFISGVLIWSLKKKLFLLVNILEWVT